MVPTLSETCKETFQTRMHQLIAEGHILSVISQFKRRREDPEDFLFSAAESLLAGRLIINGNGGNKAAPVNPRTITEILKRINEPPKRNQLANNFRDFCQEKGWMGAYLSLCQIMEWERDPKILETIKEKKQKAGNHQSVRVCTLLAEEQRHKIPHGK